MYINIFKELIFPNLGKLWIRNENALEETLS